MKKLFFILLVSIILCSCHNYSRQMAEQIIEMEKEMEGNPDLKKMDKIIQSSQEFIKKFPDDTFCKGFMLKIVDYSILKNDADMALSTINTFITKYGDDKRAAQMQFKKAVVYDLLIKDATKAVNEYELFVKKYPTHPYVKDAEGAISLINNPEMGIEAILSDSLKVDSLK